MFNMADIRIAPVTQSAFALMDEDEEEKASVERLAAEVRGATNWFARKKMLLELFDELDATADIAAEVADSPEFAELLEKAAMELRDSAPDIGLDGSSLKALDEEGLDEDLLPEDPFAVIAPVYVAAVLERLGEDSILCIEQAAFYFLSMHPEHQEAANAWMTADPQRVRLFRKFIKANPGYGEAARRIMTGAASAEE
jgi:hypothetical protein